MIFDQIKNLSCYKGLSADITRALEEMAFYTAENYPAGRVDIDGDNLFLLFNSYQTHRPEGALSEAHQKYIDVMYMVEGEEIIYIKPTDALHNITTPYDCSTDALLALTDDDAIKLRLTAGSFVVLFPQDAHAPACYDATPMTVKKIIAKVKIQGEKI